MGSGFSDKKDVGWCFYGGWSGGVFYVGTRAYDYFIILRGEALCRWKKEWFYFRKLLRFEKKCGIIATQKMKNKQDNEIE